MSSPGTVSEVMLTSVKTLLPTASLDEAAAQLTSSHVHMVLLVDDDVLVGTLRREDLPPTWSDGQTAMSFSLLDDRTVPPDATLTAAREVMQRAGVRRLAVIDDAGRLLGLLCLKRSGTGFCTDEGVAARAAERYLGD